jgi:hypothetical protein
MDLMYICPTTGNTPLIWAANAGHVEVVNYIVNKVSVVQDDEGPPDNDNRGNEYLNVRGYLGATAVSRAACRGHAECVRILAQAGANLDICNDKMQYPLHFAAFKEKVECVQVLLEYQANPLVLDRKGRTPSLDTKNEEIRGILEQAMTMKTNNNNNKNKVMKILNQKCVSEENNNESSSHQRRALITGMLASSGFLFSHDSSTSTAMAAPTPVDPILSRLLDRQSSLYILSPEKNVTVTPQREPMFAEPYNLSSEICLLKLLPVKVRIDCQHTKS